MISKALEPRRVAFRALSTGLILLFWRAGRGDRPAHVGLRQHLRTTGRIFKPVSRAFQTHNGQWHAASGAAEGMMEFAPRPPTKTGEFAWPPHGGQAKEQCDHHQVSTELTFIFCLVPPAWPLDARPLLRGLGRHSPPIPVAGQELKGLGYVEEPAASHRKSRSSLVAM